MPMSLLISYILGVVTTIVGSWIASKIHVYHEARGAHRDELKAQVLQPILAALREEYEPLAARRSPIATLEFGVQEADYSVKAEEALATHGSYVVFQDPRRSIESRVSDALSEDARRNHHGKLMHEWVEFRDAWTLYARDLEDWIAEIKSSIRDESGLPVTPAEVNGDYAMHLNLAMFVYSRLFEVQGRSLTTNAVSGRERFALTDGAANVAVSSEAKIEALIGIVNRLIHERRQSASELRQRLDALKWKAQSLSSAFSFAIASKSLHNRCDLVRFFGT